MASRTLRPTNASTIELFFDLVFVFTITQLTHLVESAHGGLDLVRVFLVLTLIWWMYAGYIWLFNSLGEGPLTRGVLITAMAAFFVMALAVPRMFHGEGLTFGVAYLLVVLIHGVTLYAAGDAAARRGMIGIGLCNGTAAAFVIAAGAAGSRFDWALLLAATIAFAAATLLRQERHFSILPAHFVERHGLVLIVALGETIVSIGVGVGHDQPLDLSIVGTVVLSLGLIATFWWTYFSEDDKLAERELHGVDGEGVRSRMGILGFWYPHLLMIAGIVVVATGVKGVVGGGAEPAQEAGMLLATGMALYLLGDLAFRHAVGIGRVGLRALAMLLAFGLAAVSPWLAGIGVLAACAGLMAAMLVVERRLRPTVQPAADSRS